MCIRDRYEDMRTSEIVYYTTGVYTICDNSFSWDSSTSSLQISCVDQSACCDVTRNGYVRGLTTKIEEGSSIRGALISLITKEAGDVYKRQIMYMKMEIKEHLLMIIHIRQ